MEDDVNDPFASITNLCHISSSQEEHLRRCRFAHQPDQDSDDLSAEIPVASTGITMLSLPETPDATQNDDNAPRNNNGDDLDLDVFHTPPEGSSLASSQNEQPAVAVNQPDDNGDGVGNGEETMAVDNFNSMDGSAAVDLGKDTDLGFSLGVVSSQDKEVIHCEYMKTGVLASKDGLSESKMKKSKLLDKNLGYTSSRPCSRIEAERHLAIIIMRNSLQNFGINLGSGTQRCNLGVEAGMSSMGKFRNALEDSKDRLNVEIEGRMEKVGKSVKKSNSDGIGRRNDGFKSPQDVQIEGKLIEMDVGDRGERSAKRKLEFSQSGGNDAVLGSNGGSMEGTNNWNRLCNTSQGCSAAKSIGVIDKFRYVGPRGSISFQRKRALPASLCGKEESTGEKNHQEVRPTLLDVLRFLAKDCKHDPSLENLSILEVAKRCGMKFL